jgi:hypothetical protein
MQEAIDIVANSLKDEKDIIIVEINAGDGHTTRKLAKIPHSTIYSFEPYISSAIPNLPLNVVMNYAAVMDREGFTAMWIPAKENRYAYHRDVTYNRLAPPSVTYRQMVEVKTICLENYLRSLNVSYIDLLWIDWHKAELSLVSNIVSCIGSTSFIFVKWGNMVNYLGTPTVAPILELIGDDWEVLYAWETDVLLTNARFVDKVTI